MSKNRGRLNAEWRSLHCAIFRLEGGFLVRGVVTSWVQTGSHRTVNQTISEEKEKGRENGSGEGGAVGGGGGGSGGLVEGRPRMLEIDGAPLSDATGEWPFCASGCTLLWQPRQE